MTDNIEIHQVPILWISQLVKKQMSDFVGLLVKHWTLSLGAVQIPTIIYFEMNKIYMFDLVGNMTNKMKRNGEEVVGLAN